MTVRIETRSQRGRCFRLRGESPISPSRRVSSPEEGYDGVGPTGCDPRSSSVLSPFEVHPGLSGSTSLPRTAKGTPVSTPECPQKFVGLEDLWRSRVRGRRTWTGAGGRLFVRAGVSLSSQTGGYGLVACPICQSWIIYGSPTRLPLCVCKISGPVSGPLRPG